MHRYAGLEFAGLYLSGCWQLNLETEHDGHHAKVFPIVIVRGQPFLDGYEGPCAGLSARPRCLATGRVLSSFVSIYNKNDRVECAQAFSPSSEGILNPVGESKKSGGDPSPGRWPFLHTGVGFSYQHTHTATMTIQEPGTKLDGMTSLPFSRIPHRSRPKFARLSLAAWCSRDVGG